MVARVRVLFALWVLVGALAPRLVVRVVAQEQARASKSDAILGEWWTEKSQGRIRISRDSDGTYRGTTTCCVHPASDTDNPPRDLYNPNPKLRGRSTLGIVLIWKLKYEDGEWVDGYVYNPRDGKTYRIEMKVLDAETLKIRGYMGISLFGQNQIWKRAHVRPSVVSAARL